MQSMHYILIDDNAQALSMLMQAVAANSQSIVAIWPSTADLSLTTLPLTETKLHTESNCVKVIQVRSQMELAEAVGGDVGKEPTVLCSDLTMRADQNSIGLVVDQNGWKNAGNIVRMAFQSFLARGQNLVCLHSGTGAVAIVADLMGGASAGVFGLTQNFEEPARIDRAQAIAAAIQKKVAEIDKTPLEKLWANSEAMKWFTGSGTHVPHNWPHNWVVASEDYQTEVAQAIKDCVPADFPEIPSAWWCESFHESLKGANGAYFCGTEPDASGTKRQQPLRLGGVALIAALAHAWENRDFGPFGSGWNFLSPDIASRRYLDEANPMGTKSFAIALWFFFRLVFSADRHNGRLVNLKALNDGFELTFSWKAAEFCRDSRNSDLTPTTVEMSLEKEAPAKHYPKPDQSRVALADALRQLAFEPGRILPAKNPHGIRIQAVGES